MDFKTITLDDAFTQKLYVAKIVIQIAKHEWCPAISDEPTFASGTTPFADFGPTTKWILKQCHLQCDSIETCKKVSLAEAIADTTRANAFLSNFNSIFGVSQNKKTALLIRTRKKQKNSKKKKVESSDEESEEDDESDKDAEDADADADEADVEAEPEESEFDEETPESDSDDEVVEEEIEESDSE